MNVFFSRPNVFNFSLFSSTLDLSATVAPSKRKNELAGMLLVEEREDALAAGQTSRQSPEEVFALQVANQTRRIRVLENNSCK